MGGCLDQEITRKALRKLVEKGFYDMLITGQSITILSAQQVRAHTQPRDEKGRFISS